MLQKLFGAILLAVIMFLSPPIRAQTEEEKAALILFESGKKKFQSDNFKGAREDLSKALAVVPDKYAVFVKYYLALSFEQLGQCREASPLLKALQLQLKAEHHEQISNTQKALNSCILNDAENLANAGNCRDCNQLLHSIRGDLRHLDWAKKARIVGSCEVRKAKSLAEQGQCKEAIKVLEGSSLEFASEHASRRKEITQRCRRELIGFVPDTASKKAAWVLVEKALELMDQEKPRQAAMKLRTALKVHEDPHIHMHASRAFFAQFDCIKALSHANETGSSVPEFQEEVQAMAFFCAVFSIPASANLPHNERRNLMQFYREANLPGVRGKPATLDALAETLASYDNPRLRLYLGSTWIDEANYSAAAAVLEGVKGRLPERKKEVTELLDFARFAAVDENVDPAKKALFDRWVLARNLIDDGAIDDAETYLLTIADNPYVARSLGQISARRGDCDRTVQYLDQARKKLGKTKADFSLLRQCETVARAIFEQREREAVEAEEKARLAEIARKNSAVKNRKILSYCLIGGGIVVAGASGYFFWKYYDYESDIGSKMDQYKGLDWHQGQPAFANLREDVDHARSQARIHSAVGYAMVGVGVGVGVAGLAVLLTTDSAPSDDGVAVSPLMGKGVSGLSISGGF